MRKKVISYIIRRRRRNRRAKVKVKSMFKIIQR
jgi:hypothetical protein